MKNKNKNIKAIMAVILIFAVLAVVAGVVMATRPANAPAVDEDINSGEFNDESSPQITDGEQNDNSTIPDINAEGMKAMWISYLEFQSVDFSDVDSFADNMTEMFTNCKNMGLNTVIVQVRPFGDALYKSEIFPTSHLVNGTQGAELTFDPLEEMVKIAHEKGLRIEVWVNPYRVQLHGKMPDNIADSNPAKDESLVFNVGGGIYYNPALTEVQDMVVKGIEEIVNNYDVDGIHLDDYFYHEQADMSVDEAYYRLSSTNASQADWRRENVNTLVKKIYKAVKAIDKNVTFGISPQGNNDNNYTMQYSDVKLWLSEEGYVDYIMPQNYWGFNYRTKSGSDRFAFENLLGEWGSYPCHENVKLYIGMGAYRIGAGDGGANDQSEWDSGENLAKMVKSVGENENTKGFALYRYDNLFKNSEYAQLAQSEVEALTQVLNK